MAQCGDTVAELAERGSSIRRISSEELRVCVMLKGRAEGSIARSFRHLISSEVRAALRKDPLLAKLDTRLRRTVGKLGTKVEDALRASVEGPQKLRGRLTKRRSMSLFAHSNCEA